MANILVFGASIVFGKVDTKGGWVQYLRTFLEEKALKEGKDIDSFDVYNLSINGGTTADLLNRLECEAIPRLSKDKTITIISIGLNDSMLHIADGKNRISEDQYENNLVEMAKTAKEFSKVIFIGLTPIDENKTNPIPWRKEYSYQSKFVKQYNEIMQKVAEEQDTCFIDLLSRFNNSYIELLDDGVHPNDEGHKQIFEIIKRELEEKEII